MISIIGKNILLASPISFQISRNDSYQGGTLAGWLLGGHVGTCELIFSKVYHCDEKLMISKCGNVIWGKHATLISYVTHIHN